MSVNSKVPLVERMKLVSVFHGESRLVVKSIWYTWLVGALQEKVNAACLRAGALMTGLMSNAERILTTV